MESITILIRYSEMNEGYVYDIFKGNVVDERATSEDGGLCTGTMLDALGMAAQQAEPIIRLCATA